MKIRALKVNEQPLVGSSLRNWLKLLWMNRFRINIRYWPRALFISLIILSTFPFRIYERLKYNKKIKKTEIIQPPIIILGHWRSGTTYLHMLMTRNNNSAFCTNFTVFMPWMFISGEKLFKKVVQKSMPTKRRMDNVYLRVDEPNEEEFGLINFTHYSQYHGISFPNERNYFKQFCSFEGVSEKIINKWRSIYLYYLKKITFHSGGKRLILKNPPSTARIKHLLAMFPNAKFIHIHRNPLSVFSSTKLMYNTQFPYFYLQETKADEDEFIIETYFNLYKKFFEEKDLIPKENYIEISYHELYSNPLETIKQIYQKLKLDGFEEGKPQLEAYIATQKTYKTNKHNVDETTKKKLYERWAFCFKAWDYKMD
ncbi:MAG: sulfotransferase [Candidatus Heimdallarchaeota archaeon]|nr:sulfotransferase [Candidatus Heimdallarchaeota archaeon]